MTISLKEDKDVKTSLLKNSITIGVAIALTAIPALANDITKAKATETCTSYTIEVQGTDLYESDTATVSYSITATPKSGSPIVVTGTFGVMRTGHGNNDFEGSTTQNWPTTLTNNYKLTGTVTLNELDGNTISIVFSPAILNCTAPPPGSCSPSSSLGILSKGKTVTGYVPNGNWSSGTTGLQVVPIEPIGTPSSIATPNIVNSCAGNGLTGEVVCTGNNTDVYLITGTTLNTTLTSSSNAFAGFSGGSCENCGVAMNASANKAVISMGLNTAPSGSGLQFLDLATNTFETPILANNEVSEDVLWDPIRNYILSPNEEGNYDIFQVPSSGSVTEYGNPEGVDGDSAAEDCSTGIALSSIEFSSQLYITDLTQAVFSAGPPATWTAPSQVVTFPEFGGFSAGTDGIAVAAGSPTSHLGIVTGEFGGNQFGVFELPSTSGSGTPSFVDYAAAVLPNTPDGNVWSDGLDPHTITAYVSPNNGKAYGVMANFNGTNATYLAWIDLQALLSAPRVAGTHTVDPSYNLLTSGVVTYIAVQ
jgi:hypothetical protein